MDELAKLQGKVESEFMTAGDLRAGEFKIDLKDG